MYRSDWLSDWQHGRDQILRGDGSAQPLTPDQLWQARLWRAILQDLPEQQRQLGRVNVHQRFLAACAALQAPQQLLPRRVVVFGVSALPRQTLEALAALADYTQVILAVPNPCQFYWGDIIDGRELLKAQFKRQPARHGRDLAHVPLAALHSHSHPLLAAWGKLGRDFIRMLDEFDQNEAARGRFNNINIDFF